MKLLSEARRRGQGLEPQVQLRRQRQRWASGGRGSDRRQGLEPQVQPRD
jgi:hypothetical protein